MHCPKAQIYHMSRSSNREGSRPQFCNLKETGRWWNLLTYLLWKTTGKHNWGGDVFSRLDLWTYLTHADKESETEKQSPGRFCVPVRTSSCAISSSDILFSRGERARQRTDTDGRRYVLRHLKSFQILFSWGERGKVQRKTALGSKTALQRLRRVSGNLDPENVSPIEVTSSLPAGWMGPADRHAHSSYGAGAFIFRVTTCARN
jgi:hypothetical protein